MTAKGTTGSRKELPQSLEDSVREDLAKNLKERNMQFRYKTVENVMAPLIHQVSHGSSHEGQLLNHFVLLGNLYVP